MSEENVLIALLDDVHNKKCVDCSVMDSTHASVDFGVFICYKCAAYHRLLKIEYSPIIELDKEPLNAKQQKFLEKGGNLAFRNFMMGYDLNDQIPEMKYETVAANYYRARLKAIVEGKKFYDDFPEYDDGREPVKERAEEVQIEAEEEKSHSALSYLTSGFTAVVGAAKNIGSKASEKIKNSGIGDKISRAGETIASKSKSAGVFLLDKTKVAATAVYGKGKEIAENEKVRSVASSAKNGIVSATSAVTSAFSNFFWGSSKEEVQVDEYPVPEPELSEMKNISEEKLDQFSIHYYIGD